MSELIICPHCGQVVDIADPRIKRLSPAAFAVWHRVQYRFARGEQLGASEVARITDLAQPTAWYHLQQMRRAGLLVAVPKRAGGKYKVYQAA